MKKAQYHLQFLTPAFLGNADQNGQWRTPPFKAQLRQWWRVAYAAAHGFQVDVNQMRREEGVLFGNAWLENAFCKSQVRLRLDRWDQGSLGKAAWPSDSSVTHPEVKNREGRTIPVGSALYLGYGPLTFDKQHGTTALKGNAAIQANDSVGFSLAFPEDNPLIDRALWLMHQYGTVGGRSRNGWGSYELAPEGETPKLQGEVPLRPWRDCLDRDWPHAIGRDEKGALIWQTAAHDDWKSLMRTLVIIKIGLRTQFRFTTGRNAAHPERRHWLSYPVTHHDVRGWANLRLPNSLRFKVRKTESGKLVGVIFHMPCLAPVAFQPDRRTIIEVWECVHRFLDSLSRLPHQRALCNRADREALEKQQSHLEGVMLERIQE